MVHFLHRSEDTGKLDKTREEVKRSLDFTCTFKCGCLRDRGYGKNLIGCLIKLIQNGGRNQLNTYKRFLFHFSRLQSPSAEDSLTWNKVCESLTRHNECVRSVSSLHTAGSIYLQSRWLLWTKLHAMLL
ncbi:hypothetical protein AMELA_G00296720 [Ameiurus melas]|uniref:Uncharacterized protein n=1 Tax=Ameiurus melas TaxID=219545 RepID=A0A7J5ZK34_AMEME|nr:hypothetical protein AMELA_G00296720 [Ameiurus melas]